MQIFRQLKHSISKLYNISSSERYISFLKKQGVSIGNNVIFREPRSTRIDLSRPCLVTIGNDVDINTHFTIMTHDFGNFVFRNLFSDYVNSSGAVSIGNNIYFGTQVTILKSVSIGDNCIIGAGSIVTKDIPANSVAAGCPCRVICTIEEYYQKRKKQGLEEAKEYVRAFRKRNGRNPYLNLELREEWMYFIDSTNIDDYPEIPVRQRVGKGFEQWLKNYKAPYHSYEEFMDSIK